MSDLDGPRPFSFSRISTYQDCGEKYRLRYIEGYPETIPAWWSVAGRALHLVTEEWDRGHMDQFNNDPAVAWAWALWLEVKKALARYPDVKMEDWRTNAKNEGASFWEEAGVDHFQRYIDWRINTKWEVEYIEPKLNGEIAGKPYVGYIDRVFITDDGERVIVDLKSGSRVPYTHLQHGFYRELLFQQEGVLVDKGAFFKTAKGELTPLVDLSQYTPTVTTLTERVMKAEEHGVYMPTPSYFCGSCLVREHCSIAQILPSRTVKARKKPLTKMTPKKRGTA